MYIDGVCPDNQWHFPYKAPPSLLAVHAAVQRQMNLSVDPFSRLNKRSDDASSAPPPVLQCLYTAALLPKSSLQAIEARERRSRGLPGAPLAIKLLRARSLLEAVALQQRKDVLGGPSTVQPEFRCEPADDGLKDSNGEPPIITASKRQHSPL